MTVRVKRNQNRVLARSLRLKTALGQGHSAEANDVLAARKARFDRLLRSLYGSLKGGPVQVAPKKALLTRTYRQRSSNAASADGGTTERSIYGARAPSGRERAKAD